MAMSFMLTLAGTTSVDELIARAFPDPATRPEFGPAGEAFSADLRREAGFSVSVMEGTDGYVDATVLGAAWLWEPPTYTSLQFRWAPGADPKRATRAMVAIVKRVLDSGEEDAAFVSDTEALLLRRDENGTVRFSEDDFWREAGAAADEAPAPDARPRAAAS